MSAANAVLGKLAKLVRHEQSAREIGNLAEAEAFASKIQELLTTHKLEMSQVEFEEREQSEPIEEQLVSAREVGIRREARRVEWQESLANAVAHCNGCQLLTSQVSNTVFFVGRTSDRQVCAQLYGYFVRLAFELAEKDAIANKEQQKAKCMAVKGAWYNGADFAWWMRRYKKSFCVGFSSAIQSRLYEQYRELEEQKKAAEGENCTAMVYIARDSEAVSKWIEERFKGRKESKAKDNIDENFSRGFNRDAYHSGSRAGKSVALTANVLSGGAA